MKKFGFFIMVFLSLFSFSFKNYFINDEINLKVKFVNKENGKLLLTTDDEFTNSLSKFDIQSRLQSKEINKLKYFQFLKEQVRDWNNKEIKKVNSLVESINLKINKLGLKVNFPDSVLFVKTTSKEEGEAVGYTRANYVVLKENFLKQPDDVLENTIIHELFHILTRKDSEFRKKMYSIIGFNECNIIEYPNKIKDFKITNPDAPVANSYIRLKNNNDEDIDCIMILYANREYNGGVFFNYLKVGFLVVNGQDNNKEVTYMNQNPVIYNFKDIKGFYEKVGKNTEYIIQPEEILAENFVSLIIDKQNLPNPEIIIKMKAEMQK